LANTVADAPFRLLLANAPRAYRDALATAVRALRPDLDVHLGEPEHLDADVLACRPDLVICSELSPAVETDVRAWAVVYPGGARLSVVGLDGEQATAADLDLDVLLALIDRASHATGVLV
jgi:hypothetical protein